MSNPSRFPPSPTTGWVASAIASAALAVDALVMIAWPQTFAGALAHIEYPPHHLRVLALILAVGICAYLTRRFATLGCALLTAFLGGAVAMHARLEEVVSIPVLICCTLGALLWAGLELRTRGPAGK
ncbi:DoxX family protein [Sphingomonas sp. ST-64]|uniref:DoxX family protein n=1 Tax=Sphingomonas plantiphila TaxID=3163295 RepID=A0ABW8YRX4_9SPHN